MTNALMDYYDHPEDYVSTFERYLPHLSVLINGIFWTKKYPRLITNEQIRALYATGQARLRVIGDISADIEGSVECLKKVTLSDNPCYLYEAASGKIRDGYEGDGPVIMAVDNLPCELPRESSEHFSSVLREMMPDLTLADFTSDFESLNLPSHLKKAIVVHKGELAPGYRYLQEFLQLS